MGEEKLSSCSHLLCVGLQPQQGLQELLVPKQVGGLGCRNVSRTVHIRPSVAGACISLWWLSELFSAGLVLLDLFSQPLINLKVVVGS